MKKAVKIILIVVLAIAILIVGGLLVSGIIPISWGMHDSMSTHDGVALNGLDVVSYFHNGPVEGTSDITAKYKGVIWQFASDKNKMEFEGNPEKYLPAYGGYCVKAISTGFAVAADPTVYTIHEGKLFVFSSQEVKDEFLKDPKSIIDACSKNWD